METFNISEAFQQLKMINEETFDLSSKEDLDAADEFLIKDEDDESIEIIDLEAETEEDLKDSYIGNVILDCNICHSKIYKAKEDVVLCNDGDCANIDEECPYCYSNEGYKIIGEIAPYMKEEEKKEPEDTEFEVEVDGEDIEVEEPEDIEESLDEGVFDNVFGTKQQRFANKQVRKADRNAKKVEKKTDRMVKKAERTGKEGIIATAKNKSDAMRDDARAKQYVAHSNKVTADSKADDDRRNAYYDKKISGTSSQTSKDRYVSNKEQAQKRSDDKRQRAFDDVANKYGKKDDDDRFGRRNESLTEDRHELARRIRRNDFNYDSDIDAKYAEDDGTYIQLQDRETHEHRMGVNGRPKVSSHTWGRVWKDGNYEKSFEGPKYEVRKDMARYLDDDSIDESFEKVNIETESDMLEMSSDENGKVTVTTEPKKEMIAPVSTETAEEIIDDNMPEEDIPEEDEETVEYPVDEFSEEEFDDLGESYFKRIYENVNSFKTINVSQKNNSIVVEGIIDFKTKDKKNSKKRTSFVFEAYDARKDGKVRFVGMNENLSRGKKSYVLTGRISNNKFISESLNYNYNVNGARVCGTINTRK